MIRIPHNIPNECNMLILVVPCSTSWVVFVYFRLQGGKKGGVPNWKNIAIILPDTDGPSPAKKKRKN
jgi:hypothetical protein